MTDQQTLLSTFKPKSPGDWVGLMTIAGGVISSVMLAISFVTTNQFFIKYQDFFGLLALVIAVFEYGVWRGFRKKRSKLPNARWLELKQAIEDTEELGRLFDRNYIYLSDEGKKQIRDVDLMNNLWIFAVKTAIDRMEKDKDYFSIIMAATILQMYCVRVLEFAKSNEGVFITREFEDLYNRRITSTLEPLASSPRYQVDKEPLWFPRGSLHIARIV